MDKVVKVTESNRGALRYAEQSGKAQRVIRSAYLMGSGPPRHWVHREICTRTIAESDVTMVGGIACTTPLRTLLDLAAELNATHWEQALESALRQRLVKLDDVESRSKGLRKGGPLIRSVLKQRGNVPPTESLLETLTVQLFRSDATIPTPIRQFEIHNNSNAVVARLDLAFPEQRLFVELDGRHHAQQGIHDINRQNLVIAQTGWRVARFTWNDIVRTPNTTLRTMRALLAA